MSTSETIEAIRQSLSLARISTFELESPPQGPNDPRALALYAWNARISSAFLLPLHLCEIVMRNAVSTAIEAVYGPMWPWSTGFIQSLPTVAGGYDAIRDIKNARRNITTTGKVIAELKFVFWQKMFTARYEQRLWEPHLRSVLPHLDPTKTAGELRQTIYDCLERIRDLRNRIAHHEPIFKRDLDLALHEIAALVGARCKVTAAWMMANQSVLNILKEPRTFKAEPNDEDVAQLAYLIWAFRGKPAGSADQDWVLAEQELRGGF